jgi:hypothetical protein
MIVVVSLLISTFAQHVDTFVYEMGLQEPDLGRRAKIDYLKLSLNEWSHVGQFADLLSVCAFQILYAIVTKFYGSFSSLTWLSKHFHLIRVRHSI